MKKLISAFPVIYIIASITLLIILAGISQGSITLLIGFFLVMILISFEAWKIRRQSSVNLRQLKDAIAHEYSGINGHLNKLSGSVLGVSKQLVDHESSRARSSLRIMNLAKDNARQLSDHEAARIRASEKERLSISSLARRMSEGFAHVSLAVLDSREGIQEVVDAGTTQIGKQIRDHEGSRARAAKRSSDMASAVIAELSALTKQVSELGVEDAKDAVISETHRNQSEAEGRVLAELDNLVYEILLLKRHLDGESNFTLNEILDFESTNNQKNID